MAEQTIDIGVRGMTCAACVTRVDRALRAVEGVDQVAVNLATERATVRSLHPISVQDALERLRRGGYEPLVATTELAFDRSTDAGALTAATLALPGVVRADISGNSLMVEYLPTMVAAPEIAAKLSDAGFAGIRAANAEADAVDPAQQAAEREQASLQRDVRIAMALAIPLFVVGMGHMVSPAFNLLLHNLLGHFGLNVLMFALATPVLFGPGRRFLVHGARAAFAGSPDMNTLVALGTVAAWSYSTVATFAPRWLPAGAAHVYYEAAAVVIALVLLGKLLEARARRSAAAAIAALARRLPKKARVRRGGTFVEIDSAWLHEGDVVQVGPGEAFAVDGTVVVGATSVDESMLTGESMPIARKVGDEVAAGTVNLSHTVDVVARRVGGATTLARLAAAVEAAQVARPQIQRLADRVIGVFVPIVLLIAAITLVGWLAVLGTAGLAEALSRAVAVLVIACPCAMGLATPISIVVATGRAAELGIVFADGSALERLGNVSRVFFDKTGTLTEGRPHVVAVEDLGAMESRVWLAYAAAAEASSSHPLALAVGEHARAVGAVMLDAARHELVAGAGIEAEVDGSTVRVGSEDWLGLHRDPLVAGATHVAVAIDGEPVGRLAIADRVRAGSAAAIAALQAQGVATTMLSGDSEMPARSVGAEVGVDEVVWRCTPESKAARVAEAQAGGAVVAFVGDGVNDGPAIARADVGIAMGNGTDVAIGAAHVVLVSGEPERIATARSLSRATLRNIRWNLVWAFGYNVVLIPLAAGALVPLWPRSGLSPVLAGAAMAFSSTFVVSNALRLRRFGQRAHGSTNASVSANTPDAARPRGPA